MRQSTRCLRQPTLALPLQPRVVRGPCTPCARQTSDWGVWCVVCFEAIRVFGLYCATELLLVLLLRCCRSTAPLQITRDTPQAPPLPSPEVVATAARCYLCCCCAAAGHVRDRPTTPTPSPVRYLVYGSLCPPCARRLSDDGVCGVLGPC